MERACARQGPGDKEEWFGMKRILVCEDESMLRLEKVNGKNVWDILKLRVAKEQENFVAHNDISIIEAYTAITGNGYAFPFGIYENDTPIGFLMIGFDTDDYWDDAHQWP